MIRSDQCTSAGTPYQKPQVWLTTIPNMISIAAVCSHKTPHEVKLVGSNTRRSQPYPRELALKIVESWISQYTTSGRLGDSAATVAVNAYLVEQPPSTDHRQSRTRVRTKVHASSVPILCSFLALTYSVPALSVRRP